MKTILFVGNCYQRKLLIDYNGICSSLLAAMGEGGNNIPVIVEKVEMDKVGIKQATKKGYIECRIGGVADFSYPTSTKRRGRVQGGGDISPTIMASESEICKVEKGDDMENEKVEYRIRKLTPRECWRLMDYSDEDYDKAAEINSKTQLYRQAGNGIVKNVPIAIFGQMIPNKENIYKEREDTQNGKST